MADNDTGSEHTQPQTPDDTHVAERFLADALRGNVVKPEEDPFDPARLRIAVDPASAIATRTITFTVPVRSRPDSHTFFRVHPEWHVDAYLLELKERREVYLITPELAPELEGELKAVTLYTAIYRGGSPFIWLGATMTTARVDYEPDTLLTVPEAAPRLGMSEDYMYRHAREFPFFVQPNGARAVRFSLRGVERYLQEQRKRQAE